MLDERDRAREVVDRRREQEQEAHARRCATSSVYATSAQRRAVDLAEPRLGGRSSVALRATGGGSAGCREVDESMKVDAVLSLTCQTETRAFAVYASACDRLVRLRALEAVLARRRAPGTSAAIRACASSRSSRWRSRSPCSDGTTSR